MKYARFFILLIFSTFSAFTFAEEKNCTIKGAVRCPCPASMSVSCAGVKGYIKNEEKIKSAVVTVTSLTGTKKQMTLTEAQLAKNDVRDLYGIDYEADLKKSLGLSENDKLDVVNFSVDSKTALYDDTEATSAIAPGQSGNEFSANYSKETYKGCQASSDYEVYKLSTEAVNKCKCTNKIPVICSIKIYCDGTSDLGFGQGVSACPQVNGKCPSLKDCIDDTYVDPDAFGIEKDSMYKKDSTNSSGVSK